LRWLAEIEAEIPSLLVQVVDATGTPVSDARLTIDGYSSKLEGNPIPLDPGTHRIVAETSADAHVSSEVSLVPGDRAKTVVLQLPQTVVGPGTPTPVTTEAAPSATIRTSAEPRPTRGIPAGAWVLGGTAVAAFGTAAYLIYDAYRKLDTLKGPPPAGCAPWCTDAQTAPGRAEVLAADVTTGIGIAALGGAIAWSLLARPARSAGALDALLAVSPMAGGAFVSLHMDR
jgi:hypothetical protein